MDVIEYEGRTYHRYESKWTDENGMVVYDILQDKLDVAYEKSIDPSRMGTWSLIKTGDKFKANNSIGKAIKYYELAIEKVEKRDMAYILPRLSSCYRIQGQPKKVIELLTYANRKYGQEMVTSALLTSAAAAYCDLGEYGKARKCCDRAHAIEGKDISGELRNVYARIRKEYGA